MRIQLRNRLITKNYNQRLIQLNHSSVKDSVTKVSVTHCIEETPLKLSGIVLVKNDTLDSDENIPVKEFSSLNDCSKFILEGLGKVIGLAKIWSCGI